MPTKELSIKNIQVFLKNVTSVLIQEATLDSLFLYRGQRNVSWDLLPKISRTSINSDFLIKEKESLNEFKRMGHPYMENHISANTWNLIALAQHFGLSTRLLDWTANPLVALWFAFFEEDNSITERAVWVLMLDNSELANIEKGTPFNQSTTKAFKPNHITRRITAQNGWFTTHRFITATDNFIKLNTNKAYKDKIVKFIIPNSERENILAALNILGINYFSLFPDLDGLAKYLEWKNHN